MKKGEHEATKINGDNCYRERERAGIERIRDGDRYRIYEDHTARYPHRVTNTRGSSTREHGHAFKRRGTQRAEYRWNNGLESGIWKQPTISAARYSLAAAVAVKYVQNTSKKRNR